MSLISSLLGHLADDIDMALIEGRPIHPRDLRPLVQEIRELYRREGFGAPLVEDDERLNLKGSNPK